MVFIKGREHLLREFAVQVVIHGYLVFFEQHALARVSVPHSDVLYIARHVQALKLILKSLIQASQCSDGHSVQITTRTGAFCIYVGMGVYPGDLKGRSILFGSGNGANGHTVIASAAYNEIVLLEQRQHGAFECRTRELVVLVFIGTPRIHLVHLRVQLHHPYVIHLAHLHNALIRH